MTETGYVLEVIGIKDYDFISPVTAQKIEVKTDRWTYKTGNVCLELWSHIEKKHEGWMQYSKAEILAYLIMDEDIQPKCLDVYNFIALKDYVYWTVLDGDWYNKKPKVGRIVSTVKNVNPNVVNLIISKEDVSQFLIETICC